MVWTLGTSAQSTRAKHKILYLVPGTYVRRRITEFPGFIENQIVDISGERGWIDEC